VKAILFYIHLSHDILLYSNTYLYLCNEEEEKYAFSFEERKRRNVMENITERPSEEY
jgi:hypothetical protein